MSIKKINWDKFWKDKISPLHHSENISFYKIYAKELRLLMNDENPNSLLEIACGSGELFSLLGFDKIKKYIGIDFSDSMLNQFIKKYPEVTVLRKDACQYITQERYDIIFCNAALQCFPFKKINLFFKNMRKMMKPHSLLTCASLPLKPLKKSYHSLSVYGKKQNFLASSYSLLNSFLCDTMGHWFTFDELIEFAKKENFEITFHGSFVYPYRIHAVLKIPNNESKSN